MATDPLQVAADRELARRLRVGGGNYLAFVLCTLFVTPHWREHPRTNLLMSLILALCWSARLKLTARLATAAEQDLSVLRRRLHLTMACNALTWGTFVAITLARYDRLWTAQMFVMALAAFLSGIVTQCAPSPTLGVTCVWLMMAPSILSNLWPGQDLVYSIILSPYMYYMVTSARQHARDWRDATEARFLISAQRHELDDLNRMLEGMEVGLAVVDADDTVVELNPFLCDLMRLPRERLLGSKFSDHLEASDRKADRGSFKNLFGAEAEPYHREVRCRRGGGELAWLQMAVSLIPGKDSSARAIRALTDISDRRLQQVVEFQETERNLLAAELHDVISQPLVGLYYELQGLQENATLSSQAHLLLQELRALMRTLRGPQGDFDVCAALQEFIEDYSVQQNIAVSTDICEDVAVLEGIRAIFLYRVVVESLVNVRRHSHATQVHVSVTLEGAAVRGSVCDNGGGFVVEAVDGRRRFGIRGMRERCELLGGSFDIASQIGQGTHLAFEIPIEA
jgi:PAS domain S-box-containing protein